jgi:hypothetical protein
MAKKPEPKTLDLEALAAQLEALAAQATEAGEEKVARSIGYSVKSARFALKQKAVRVKRVGSLIEGLKAKGLSAEQIVAELTR